jgi:hypothetical protein
LAGHVPISGEALMYYISISFDLYSFMAGFAVATIGYALVSVAMH